jgi:predicted short-subunit dehydrogenase-like oxidoreductase (DUF2520 family)
MEIVIIGTGNTAAILGRKLKAAGHEIVQIFGRDSKAASDLAYELDTESTNYWNVVHKTAGLYILAVSDIAIEDVLRELRFSNQTVVHTAASVPKDVLKNASGHYGVFYPLQSLKKETRHLPDTPIILDASDVKTLQALEELAHSISDKVVHGDDDLRLKLHLAAVFCNNFVNHLYALAEQYCRREGIEFSLLLPLIEETALRMREISPSAAQTGPAVRQDLTTLDRHRELLKDYPELMRFYILFSDSIGRVAGS